MAQSNFPQYLFAFIYVNVWKCINVAIYGEAHGFNALGFEIWMDVETPTSARETQCTKFKDVRVLNKNEHFQDSKKIFRAKMNYFRIKKSY